jgi:hypothetical protein
MSNYVGISVMAASTGYKIRANELEISNSILTTQVSALTARLELVADSLVKLGLLEDIPHERYKFVHGAATNHFPSVLSEFVDVDGNPSN